MEDAVAVLSRQHDELGRLMREVEGLPRISLDAAGPDPRRLQGLMNELGRCFVVHERLRTGVADLSIGLAAGGLVSCGVLLGVPDPGESPD